MPNLWTKTTQMIYEAFKAPRTVDIEFNGKYEEIKIYGIPNKKYIFNNKVIP